MTMEHIRQFDWCSSKPDIYFLNETDLDNSITERILQNRYFDPLLSSDSEDERPTFDWKKIFQRRNYELLNKKFVAGLRKVPLYPKLSALTEKEHYICLKVLCYETPDLLKNQHMPRPMKHDFKIFEEVKEKYAKEQKEFLQWAKVLWTTNQCIRALRPKPGVEMVYEAEFKMRAREMASFPKRFELAAQIPLESRKHSFDLVFQTDLIKVDRRDLPEISLPDLGEKVFTIFQPCDVPEPCHKHPCKFVLPTERAMSILPLTEIHRELAQYALDQGALFIASENALKCLVEVDKSWILPLSVCEVINADGERVNVKVLGSAISVNRESAQARTHRAFRHLLQHSLLPASERAKIGNRSNKSNNKKSSTSRPSTSTTVDCWEISSDEDDDTLYIAELFTIPKSEPKDSDDELVMDVHPMEVDAPAYQTRQATKKSLDGNRVQNAPPKSIPKVSSRNNRKSAEFYTCTCQGSSYENPPLRSFKKWQVRNKTINDKFEVIVHCPHKVRGEAGELVMEPIPEYQVDIGASELSEQKIRSMGLSLYLRRNASLLTARTESVSGEVIRIDTVHPDEFTRLYGSQVPDFANVLHTTLDQLHGLMPGHYLMQHHPSHGTNALLFATRVRGTSSILDLNFDCSQLAEQDESKTVKAPKLCNALLPSHKHRRILPLAFSWKEQEIAKEPRKPATRQKTPPQAIKDGDGRGARHEVPSNSNPKLFRRRVALERSILDTSDVTNVTYRLQLWKKK